MLENLYTTKMSMDKKKLQKRFSKIRSSSGRISKIMSFVMSIFIAVTILCATVVMAALNSEETNEPITLYSNGKIIVLENKPFIQDNMIYFPLRETFEKLGVFDVEGNELLWDNGTIYIKVAESANKETVSYTIKIGSDSIDVNNSKDQRITNVSDNPVMKVKLTLPEEKPVLVGDKTYVPYTYIDYMLNRGLGIRNNTGIFDFMFTVNGESTSAFVSQGFVWPCDGKISNPFGEHRRLANYIESKGPFANSLNHKVAKYLRILKKLRIQSDYFLEVLAIGTKDYNNWLFNDTQYALAVAKKLIYIFENHFNN